MMGINSYSIEIIMNGTSKNVSCYSSECPDEFRNVMNKIKEFPEMKGRIGELEILESIIEDLDQKKLEIDKDQLLDYFFPFATRLISI